MENVSNKNSDESKTHRYLYHNLNTSYFCLNQTWIGAPENSKFSRSWFSIKR